MSQQLEDDGLYAVAVPYGDAYNALSPFQPACSNLHEHVRISKRPRAPTTLANNHTTGLHAKSDHSDEIPKSVDINSTPVQKSLWNWNIRAQQISINDESRISENLRHRTTF